MEALSIIVKYWQDHPDQALGPVLIVSPTDMVSRQWEHAVDQFTKNVNYYQCSNSKVCIFF